jgi:hypothetical protein
MRRSIIFAAFLASALPAVSHAAVTRVTLAANTTPGTGQAGVGYVSVVGTGFPSGTITPSAVTLSLKPATGTTETTKAVKVKVISGTEDSVTFQIPTTIVVSAPTVYAVSLAGETSTGNTFASKNTSALTIDPPSSLSSVAPASANAALSLLVTITGAYTGFVQGTTQADFGPGIAVGGAAEGALGPVTVTSPTTATAQISIDPAAAAGSQTVTVTTGTATETLTGGFTIETAVAVANINMTSTAPLAPGFSGFHDEYILNGVEYYDPKYIPFVQALKPGWLRYPGGTPSMAFDWQAGHLNTTWVNNLCPEVGSFGCEAMTRGQQLTQAKGGASLTNFAAFCQTLGATAIIDFNSWTDTNPNSSGLMVQAAQSAGLPVKEWELANEPYFYSEVFPTASSYASAMFTPYYTPINTTDSSSLVGLFYQGQFSGVANVNYAKWDNGMKAYTPHYWQGVSMHIYPITNETITTVNEEQTLNGFLAYGTNQYFNSYVTPLIGANTPLFLSEFNSDAFSTLAFESYIYNAIFLAEYIARVSTVPNLQGVGVTQLYIGNSFNQGIIRAVNDYENYLIEQVKINPNYSTNTATNPKTQFSFYFSTNALALEILNGAVNSSNATWPTTVSGGPTVPIQGYDGNPIPAVFAQGYQGTDGTHYVIITNKSSVSVPIGIEVNGLLGPASVTASYISSTSDTAQNTATAQTAVQIVNTTFTNPLTVGPYSVTSIQW